MLVNTHPLPLLLNRELIPRAAFLPVGPGPARLTHQCAFSGGSCCFCCSNCYKQSTRNFEITYCFPITASNFYPDAWFSSAL